MVNKTAVGVDFWVQQAAFKEISAGVKVALSLIMVFTVLAKESIWFHVFIFFQSLVVVKLFAIPLKVYFNHLKGVMGFVFLTVCLVAVDSGVNPLGGYSIKVGMFYLAITEESFLVAKELLFRCIASISALTMLGFSTPIWNIIGVLEKVGVPQAIRELMLLIYKYIFIMLDTKSKIQVAILSRGGSKKPLGGFFKIGANILLISFKKADENYCAMLSRGYSEGFNYFSNTKVDENKSTIFLVLNIVVLGGACLWL